MEPYRLYVLCKRDMLGPDGTRVLSVLSQPKRLCLLTYLALARQPVSRSTLTALFWPEADEVRARNNLNQAVHFLRRSTTKNVLESLDGDQLLWVPPERLWCDARELLHGGDLNGDLEGAADRDVLQGWNADDSQPLQEWLDGVRRDAKTKAREWEATTQSQDGAQEDDPDAARPGAAEADTRRRQAPRHGPTPWQNPLAVAALVLVLVVLTVWATRGTLLPGSAGLTPAARPITVVLAAPVLVAREDTHPVLENLIRHRILAGLTGISGIVVQEDFRSGTAWDRRELEAIRDPESRSRFVQVITIASGDRLETTVAVVGAGGSVAHASTVPFTNDPELLSDMSDQIAEWVAEVVARNVGSSTAATVQSLGPLPAVFGLLAGDWVGEGTLLGRPAAFTIRWTLSSVSEARLDFTNGFRDRTGVVTPVLEAVAIYTVTPSGQVVASWADNRPQAIEIEADVSDSTVVSHWTAPAERGRTEYRLEPDGTMTVRDWVFSDGELRPFGEALYRRSRAP